MSGGFLAAVAMIVPAGLDAARADPAGPPARAASSRPLSAIPQAFAIPPQSLDAALAEFSRVTGFAPAFDLARVEGLASPGVAGVMLPREALAALGGSRVRLRIAEARAASFLHGAALGQAAVEGEAIVLDEVVVEGGGEVGGVGPVDGYRAARSTSATRTDTPIIEAPASITVVPRDVIGDLNAQTLADVAALVPSVSQRQSYQGYEAFSVRGFYHDQDTGFQIDGARTANTVIFDPALFERVEVLKGPASLLYGTMEPGGVVNFVTPRATAEPFVVGGIDVGSFNDVRGVFDASYRGEGGLGFRLPVVARRYDSFRDHVDDNENIGAAPSLTLELGENTVARLSGVYIDQDIADDTVLIPLVDGKPLDIPTERFLGQPGARQKDRLLQTTLAVEHEFSDSLVWRNTVTHYRTEADRDTVANIFGLNPDGRTISRLRVATDEESNSVQGRSEIVAKGDVLGVDHVLLAGAELNRYGIDFLQSDQTLVPIDVFDPAYDPTPASEGTVFDDASQEIDTKTVGLYLQDQATLVQDRPGVHKLIAVAGLRYDAYDQRLRGGGTVFGAPEDVDESASEDALSPRLGLVYMPREDLSLYGSYSRSLQPQEGSSLGSTPTAPQEGEQYETGVKWDLTPAFSVTASLFQITKTNVPAPSPLPGITVLNGEERSRGFELEFAGELSPGWQVFGGYAYIDAVVTEGDAASEGKRLFASPEHRASLWMGYTQGGGAWEGFGGGAGVYYTGSSFADQTETVELDGYATVDAALWYRPAPIADGALAGLRPSVQLGVKNLFDEEYFLGANGFNSVTPGDPRAYYANVRLRF